MIGWSSAAARSARRRRRRAPTPTETTPPPPPKATQIIMAHRLDRARVQPAPAVRSVAGERGDQLAGAAEFVPAGRRPGDADGVALGARHHAAGVGGGDQSEPVHRHLQDPARGVSGRTTRRSRADDFWYLWRQMVSQPGVVDPAGYDLITGVQSVEGGKTAVVTFSQPYPAWRELFNDILPAHIVKDVPGGFAAGLARTMPVTGGQFRVESIDPQRDEILLARNDRFWGRARQARPDPVPPRRLTGRAGRLDPQRRHPGRPGARRRGGVRAAVRHPRGAHRAHRHAPGHAVDAARRSSRRSRTRRCARRSWACSTSTCWPRSGAGSDNTVTLAQAQVRSPSDPGYVPDRAARDDPGGRAGAARRRRVSRSQPVDDADAGADTGPPDAATTHHRGRISQGRPTADAW